MVLCELLLCWSNLTGLITVCFMAKAVILVRGTGAITVASVNTLQNLLGVSPEWFEPAPSVTWASNGSFIGLEV